MTRSLAYTNFLLRYREVTRLLAAAHRYEYAAIKRSRTDLQETANALSRSVVMLLAGHLEGYLGDLISEICDAMPSKWDTAIVPKKIFVAQAVIDDLLKALHFTDGAAPQNAKQLDALKSDVEMISAYFSKPNAVKPRRLEGYYRNDGPGAVEKLMLSLNPAGPKFFDWMEQLGTDRSRMWVTLQTVTRDRNQIAHGSLTTTKTPQDARTAVCVVVAMVRRVERYCSQHGLLSQQGLT